MIRSRSASTTTGAAIDEPLDPAIAAELAALDAALAGETIDDDALAQFVRDIQAQAPEMPGDLRKRLRHEVGEGFPRASRRARQRARSSAATPVPARRRRPRPLIAISGTAVAALVAVVVIAATGSPTPQSLSLSGPAPRVPQVDNQDQVVPDIATNKNTPSVDNLSGVTSTHPDALETRDSTEQGNAYKRTTHATSSTAASAGPMIPDKPGVATFASSAPSPSTPLAASAAARKVERVVDMAIRVNSGKLPDATTRIGQIGRQDGGYVSTSQVSLERRGAGVASYSLRISSAKLDGAIASLSALGTVIHQDQNSTDITSSFDSAQQRLKDATAVRAALLRSLGKATTAGEIASLRTRIADNRATLASLDRQLATLGRRADLTTITLSVSAPAGAATVAAKGRGGWSLGDAARDAGHVLGAVTGGLIVLAGAALPFAILALIAWPIYRARRKRRREAALD